MNRLTTKENVDRKARIYKRSLDALSEITIVDRDSFDGFFYTCYDILEEYGSSTESGKKVLKKFVEKINDIDELYFDIENMSRLSDSKKSASNFYSITSRRI